jgi:hypothetical protein
MSTIQPDNRASGNSQPPGQQGGCAPRTVNGEGDRRDHEAEKNAPDNASHNQHTATPASNFLPDMSPEEQRRMENLINAQKS